MLGAAVIAIDGPSCAALELGARSMSAVCRSQSSVPLAASSAFWALVQQSSRALTGITGKNGDQKLSVPMCQRFRAAMGAEERMHADDATQLGLFDMLGQACMQGSQGDQSLSHLSPITRRRSRRC